MHRLYLAREIIGDEISLNDARQVHYLRDVLRFNVGDELVVFDSAGNECVCAIRQIDSTQALLTVKARQASSRAPTGITVACSIPKKGLDDLVDCLTQLGVAAIIPMQTERVVVKLDGARQESRLERWNRIAQSAAQQSRRTTVPIIGPVAGFADVVSRARDFDLKLLPTLSGDRRELREVLPATRPGNILVLIGPEGDFTPQEVGRALEAGFIPVSLGDLVLRVSTAAIAVVSYLRFSL